MAPGAHIVDAGDFGNHEFRIRSELGQLWFTIVVCYSNNHCTVRQRTHAGNPYRWVAKKYYNELEYKHLVVFQHLPCRLLV